MHGLSYTSTLYEKQIRLQMNMDAKTKSSSSVNPSHITDISDPTKPMLMGNINTSSMAKRRKEKALKANSN